MLALVVDPEPRLREVPDPVAATGEAVVRISRAGICGTDLEVLSGYKSFTGILGHEMVGVVEHCSDASWLGKRVVSEINIACGNCERCREGLGRHCARRQVLGLHRRDGVFAEKVAVPVANLHAVPDAISDEIAVWTEPLAAALAVSEVGLRAGEAILVVGDGRLGALVGLGLAARGMAVSIIGKHPDKLAMLGSLGLSIERGPARPVFRWVIEATGSPSGPEVARGWVKPRGCLVLKSTGHQPATLDVSRVVVDEIRLIGSRCGEFAPALALLESGELPLQSLIAQVFPLSEAETALALAGRPGVFKVLLDPTTR